MAHVSALCVVSSRMVFCCCYRGRTYHAWDIATHPEIPINRTGEQPTKRRRLCADVNGSEISEDSHVLRSSAVHIHGHDKLAAFWDSNL